MGYFLWSLVPYFLYVILKNTKCLHALQQNSYNNSNRYIKWIVKNDDKTIVTIDFLIVIFLPLAFFLPIVFIILFVLFYVEMFFLLRKKTKHEQVKKPLVYTSRIKRLIFTTSLFYILPLIFIILNYNKDFLWLYYLYYTELVYLNYFLIYLVNLINIPAEKCVYFYYKNKAVHKLRDYSNLKIIGVTGSYGKTSSKNILSDILNIKFNALPTPKSKNTPLGIIQTINDNLSKYDDVFVVEMGACEVGQINELCDLVKPKYGILTTIGVAHLETFKTEENIQKTKFELIESLPVDGIGILNKDDDKQVSYKLKNKCRVIWIGIDNKDVDVHATNIEMSDKGMSFDVTFKGDKTKYHFETIILGKPNIYNILAGIALGKELGLTIEELKRGVKAVKPIEHRLELKKYLDVTLIDDAFNSNPIGSKMALDVLNLMPGKKIIVTPGMIELGDKQYELNEKFGEYIADVCDEVILVGKNQTVPIYDGLKNKKYDESKIHIINDVKEAFKLIIKLKDKDTYALLENDLPDIFNEK